MATASAQDTIHTLSIMLFAQNVHTRDSCRLTQTYIAFF